MFETNYRRSRAAVNRRRSSEESGQAVVELAVVMPLLLLLLFGVLQFGLLFYNYIDFTSAVRAGARKASVSRENTSGVVDTKAAIANATSVVDDSKTTVTIPAQPWSAGQEIKITASYPYTLDLFGIHLWDGPMTTSTIVRVE